MDQFWSFVQANPNLVIFLAVGLVAGWLAGLLLGGGGLIRNLIVGVLGAFVGAYVLQFLKISFGFPPLVEQIATATVGAIIVVIVARVLAR